MSLPLQRWEIPVPHVSCPLIQMTEVWEYPGGLVVKDPVLSLLWFGFDPWPGSSKMQKEWSKKKKKKKKRKERKNDRSAAKLSCRSDTVERGPQSPGMWVLGPGPCFTVEKSSFCSLPPGSPSEPGPAPHGGERGASGIIHTDRPGRHLLPFQTCPRGQGLCPGGSLVRALPGQAVRLCAPPTAYPTPCPWWCWAPHTAAG